MKYKLMVSRDCGFTYSLEAEAESIEILVSIAKPLAMFRWAIEDEQGELEDVTCPMYESILGAIIRHKPQ